MALFRRRRRRIRHSVYDEFVLRFLMTNSKNLRWWIQHRNLN